MFGDAGSRKISDSARLAICPTRILVNDERWHKVCKLLTLIDFVAASPDAPYPCSPQLSVLPKAPETPVAALATLSTPHFALCESNNGYCNGETS